MGYTTSAVISVAKQFKNNNLVDLQVAKFVVLKLVNRTRKKRSNVAQCRFELKNDIQIQYKYDATFNFIRIQ